MMYSGLIASLIVAIVFTVIVVALGRRGPWGSAWTFFLVVFLSLWIVSIYMKALGPVYFGVAWLPLLIAGTLLALLLAAAIPDANHWRDRSLRERTQTEADITGATSILPRTGASRFFWILILLMIMAIIIGMTNPQPAL